LPSDEPMPVNSIQLPKTIPKTNSLPEKTLTNSRMSVSCVRKAEKPRQQTAKGKKGRGRQRAEQQDNHAEPHGECVPFLILHSSLLP
jgi:hypothetical protein